ncbi:RNA helicase [Candidatus Marinamargulisbacteria bacterium SCGC AG-410-N11]|nr:RNA helicase [Candidatus Marinamargulisbacteria bacterium SCGC AG-410-N11]
MNYIDFLNELNISSDIIDAIKQKGFEKPTPVQEQVIPILRNETNDILAKSATGTGKTAAFGIPMLDLVDEQKSHVQGLILTPTRELALQITNELNELKGKKRISIISIYGGESIERQFRQLKQRNAIIVGTPGRIIDHLKRKKLDLSKIDYFVLDEADEMLNIGFLEDIEEIFEYTNDIKRTLLFSATVPRKIRDIANGYMNNPITVETKADDTKADLTTQYYFNVYPKEKLQVLYRVIEFADEFFGFIFCNTKRECDEISERLIQRKYNAEALHGDLSQFQRQRILDKFRKKLTQILVVTDVAARGIDINNLTHVINYSVPQNVDTYTHRIGRTGRAGKTGTAITFVMPSENYKIGFFKNKLKNKLQLMSLPTVTDMIEKKKEKIKGSIQKELEKNISDDYLEFASQLMEDNNPANIIAGLIKSSYAKELEPGHYPNINEVSSKNQSRGPRNDRHRGERNRGGRNDRDFQGGSETRLFVAKGRKDDFDARKLVRFIEEQSNVFGKRINQVRVMDAYSFISVSENDAEKILNSFPPVRGRRLVERSKEKRR